MLHGEAVVKTSKLAVSWALGAHITTRSDKAPSNIYAVPFFVFRFMSGELAPHACSPPAVLLDRELSSLCKAQKNSAFAHVHRATP